MCNSFVDENPLGIVPKSKIYESDTASRSVAILISGTTTSATISNAITY